MIETIDQAELAGWQGIHVEHECCRRGTTILPWPWLRARVRQRSLAAIAAALKCKACHAPPKTATLWRLAAPRPNFAPVNHTAPLLGTRADLPSARAE